jgi:hypothetical protein
VTPAELVDAVPLAVWLAVDGVAVYRVTRLLTLDSFPPVAHVRAKVLHRWGKSEWSELAVCAWCMSPYVGALVVTARLAVPAWWTPVALVLAWSAASGWLSNTRLHHG